MLPPPLPAARASSGNKLGAAQSQAQWCWHTGLTLPGHFVEKGRSKPWQ